MGIIGNVGGNGNIVSGGESGSDENGGVWGGFLSRVMGQSVALFVVWSVLAFPFLSSLTYLRFSET